jgi:hypothetical protein
VKELKKLLFDLMPTQPIGSTKFHGGGEYAKTIFFKIIDLGYRNFDCVYDSKKYLDKSIRSLCSDLNIKIFDLNQYSSDIKKFVDSKAYYSFYSALPNFKKYNYNFKKTKFFFTIHGLRPIEMPVDIYEYKYYSNIRDYFKYFMKLFFINKYKNKKIKELSKIWGDPNRLDTLLTKNS